MNSGYKYVEEEVKVVIPHQTSSYERITLGSVVTENWKKMTELEHQLKVEQ